MNSQLPSNLEDLRGETSSLTATVPFDDRTNPQAAVGDLSPRLMVEYLGEVGSALAVEGTSNGADALGRQMQVVRGPREAPLPVNVGLLFFNQDSRSFFPGAGGRRG